jgi:hypothetical protein
VPRSLVVLALVVVALLVKVKKLREPLVIAAAGVVGIALKAVLP